MDENGSTKNIGDEPRRLEAESYAALWHCLCPSPIRLEVGSLGGDTWRSFNSNKAIRGFLNILLVRFRDHEHAILKLRPRT
jgi:hypothetical protein